jgi:hypothetical protein
MCVNCIVASPSAGSHANVTRENLGEDLAEVLGHLLHLIFVPAPPASPEGITQAPMGAVQGLSMTYSEAFRFADT